MKTILNFIITTFGVLFILSACGGGGADVTIGLENRTCTNNPFSDDCGTSGQATRTDAITDCAENGACDGNIPEAVQTCLTDLFSKDCDSVAETIKTRTTVTVAKLRMTYCEANKANDNCQTTPTVMETCTGNPFDTDCGAIYNTNRETACRANNTSTCASTITRFCETDAVGTPANVFDTLCATYENAREIACRTGNHDSLCPATITRFCETEATPENGNTLNPLCADVKYNTPRETACRTGNHDSLCSATITRYCEVDALTNMDNLFNPLCSDNQTAMGVRNAFCMDADDAFTANCINSNNAEGITARDNFCKDTANDSANAFTDNCIDSNNAEGITTRDEFCKDTDNAFTMNCIDSGNAEGLTARNTFCGDTTNNRANAFNFSRCADNSEGIESRRIVNGDCSDGYNSFETRCAAAVATDLCIRHPFGRTQDGDNLQCDPVKYATEREKRYDFCATDTTESSSRHERACFEISDEICYLRGRSPDVKNYNLFARICQLNNYGDHEAILTACSTGNTYNIQMEACMNFDNIAGNNIICTKNPFAASAECRALNDVSGQRIAQVNRLLFCRGGNANPADNLDINDPDQVALCVVDGQTSADSVLCRATGEHSNPFSKLCLVSGSQFAAERSEFAGYCDAGDTATLNGAICPPDVTRCVGDPFHVDCINEAAYSDFRQPIVNDCEGLGAETTDLRCTETIKGCLANPYHMDCMNNRDYDKVRSDLSAKCVMNGQAAETRCSFITEEVCGTNPFADACDKDDFAEQQAGAASNCLSNSNLDYCLGEVNDCILNPFSEPASGFGCKTNVAFDKARRYYCVENPRGGGAQTISSEECKAFAKLSGNECVRNPYREGCLDAFFDSGRLREAQLNRVSYCATGTGSLTIRNDQDTDEEELCRGAFDAACTGDNAFLTIGLACFGDSEYQDARNTHLAKCQKVAGERQGVECEFTAEQICQLTDSRYENPFLSVCDEGGRNSLVARQNLIKRCENQNPRAGICDTNDDVFDILNECDDDPFDTICDDYSGAGQAYFDLRAERITDCGLGTGEDRCAGTLTTICTSNTAKSAPFAPACDNEEGIAGIRSDFLEACAGDAGVRNCAATIAGNVKTACEDDPYDSAVATAGNSMVSCLDFDFYSTPRGTRKTVCLAGTAGNLNCQGPTALTCIATNNPFNEFLCDATIPDHARAQRDFCQIRANVGPASGNVVESDCDAFLGKPTTATLLRAQTTELRATPDRTTRNNEFLKGTDTGLNTDGFSQKDTEPAEVATINMETAKYEGVRLGGDAADGIAFFAGRASLIRVEYYAGILAGADLGEPLRQETGLTVKWYGAVNWAILDTSPVDGTGGQGKGFVYQSESPTDRATRDFVLTIDLGARTFRSFFGRGATFTTGQQGFLLTGGYDATTGVITNGQVYFGARFGNGIGTVAQSGYRFDGPLIGIIGKEGALGVFHAQRQDNKQGESLAGGFVAAPPRGDYLSWTRVTDALATANDGDGAANYIRGGTEALDRGGPGALDLGASGISYTLTLADTYSLNDGRIVSFDGQPADGVSFAVNQRNGDRLYSGLLANTDVGAPLSANANYQGRIGILIHKDSKTTYDVAHDFTLNVSFGAGSFTSGGATFDAGIFQIMSGRFNQFGLISGRVSLGTSSGTLSGLIGAEGVVGSFISTTHTNGAFAGGFVARADDVITTVTPNARRTADWQLGAVRDDGTTSLTVLDSGAEIEGTQGTLRAANFYKHGTSFGSATILQTETLNLGNYTDALGDSYSLGGDATDGVTFTSATVSGATRHYVGLLSTTSLGNPVSNTDPRATWLGRFSLINASIKDENTPYTADFVLIVNFRDRSISSPSLGIPFALLDDGVADELNISGRYDGHGLIRGTVIYTNNGNAGAVTTTSGYLSGLIGVDGAIGAFVSTTGTGANDAYAGGFVAVPFNNRSEVAKGDVTPLRLKGFASLPNFPNQLTTSGFLKPASVDTLDVSDTNFLTGHTIDSNKIGRRGGVDSNDPDGYHYFTTDNTTDSTHRAYGGILSGTDLGAPVADSDVAAVWTGYFSHYDDITDRSMNFYIDFAAGTLGFANAAGDGAETRTIVNNDAVSVDYTVDGRFGSPSFAIGQLGGTVTRTFNSISHEYDILGLIGQEGAVAVFIDFALHNAGGFTVSNPSRSDYCQVDVGACLVNYADWVNSFATLPPAKLDTATPRNQFLKSTFDRLNQTGVTSPQPFGISVASSNATFDGVELGLDRNDGMAFFEGDINGTGYFYAGILSNTDLGAPVGLMFNNQPTGRWNGRFGYRIPVTYYEDFTLEIDFANRRIGAFVAGKKGNYFHLNGDYDANGAIINGTVDYGTFNANTRVQTAARQPNGVLTGIIGEQGAIGVFISDATGNAGFAGGFVAVPNTVLGADTVAVNYNDWTYSFTTRPSIYLDTTNRVSQFLASHSGATALDETGSGTVNAGDKGSLNLATATFKGEAFGGGATDGVGWFWDSANTRGYAGILSGTDLGAPLVQSGAAQVTWNGHFQANGGLSRDFILNIDFADSMITALVYHTGTNYYHLAGSFGANGVITGTVKYGTFTNLAMPEDGRVANGILTGLIGTQGAVGAFISGTGDKNAIASATPNYAGGFVATPTNALDDNVANYDDWARSFITLPPVQVDPTTPPRRNQFLGTATGDTTLSRVGTVNVPGGRRGTLTLGSSYRDVIFDGSTDDGVSFFWDNSGRAGYAGILAGTDLGAPLTRGSRAAQVTWNGQFQAFVGSLASVADVSRSFVLTINFDNPNTIEAFVQQTGDYYYHLTGRFGANGVITGEVNFGTFSDTAMRTPTDSRATNGFLTGLIGEEGAVGAFVSGVGTKDAITPAEPVLYTGGFVAKSGVENTGNNAKFSKWEDAVSPLTAPTNSGGGGDFVRGTATALPQGNRGSVITNQGTLSLTDTLNGAAASLTDTLNGVALSGTNHGVGFFRTSNRYFAAGLLSGTDLGAPLSNIAQAGEWKGRITAYSNNRVGTDPFIVNKVFTLTVTYDGPGGTISAFVRDNSPVNVSNPSQSHYKLEGTYDGKGVISGTVIVGRFAGDDANATPTDLIVPIANSANSLTGLIGERGAVGAFQALQDGGVSRRYGFTGGFVACKRNDADDACQ